MDEYYRVPTLALLSILVAVFAVLYARSRTHRTLLWLIGWSMAIARLVLQSSTYGRYGIGLAISNTAMALAALMLLASVSPIHTRNTIKSFYLAVFAAPLVVFAVLISLYPSPGFALRIIDLAAAISAAAVALHWSAQRSQLPKWFTLSYTLCISTACLWLAWIGQYDMVLRLAHSGISLMTAALVLVTYRRWSPGVIFTATGLLMWSSPMVFDFLLQPGSEFSLIFLRAVNLMKVVTAVGMIVLVLEDELLRNEDAQRRDRRVRAEMEQYSRLDVSAATNRNVGPHYDGICNVITRASRFSQAAILLRNPEQHFRLVGHAGMKGALAEALGDLGQGMTVEKMDEICESDYFRLKFGNTVLLNLRPLMAQADDLEQLGLEQVYAIPMNAGAEGVDGAVVLTGLNDLQKPLEAEDLLPLELLARRLAAEHQNNLLLRRLVQTEKLAGLGQLAGGVAHELNNPLTVVMGYAELIEESGQDETVRRGAAVIRGESQRMKQTIESLAHFSRFLPEDHAPFSVDEMLTDLWRQRKPELERLGIAFELSIPKELPKLRASVDQMRQVMLQIVSNGVTALESLPVEQEKKLRIEAILIKDRVQVLISDTGPGFSNPDRVFDPFFTTKKPREGPGLGLTLCYSIVREHGGEISAFNLQPHGAAVAIELPVDVILAEPEMTGEVFTG
jgi:two-component system, NtrC family, sensor kinase